MAIARDKVIASAEKLVAKGKIEPAIKEYERLLDDNPNDVNTLNRIGDLWVRINRNDEAVKTFGRIADHYSRDGFFLKAIAIYKKINKLDPSKLEVYGKLADLYAKQGLAMEAKSQYQVLADYYLKHGDPHSALGIYRKISELDPNSINVHVKLADLYGQSNQTGEALKEYDRVGRMLLKRGMLDEAVQVFRKALKIDPANVDLVESLVVALLEAKDYTNSIQIVEASLEANRDHPRLIALWARTFVAKGDIAAARSALERGLQSNPNDISIREALADIYLRQGGIDRAMELLAPSVDAAAARGDSKAAVELLNRVLRADPGNIGAMEKLVGVYMRVNEETNILASMNSLAEAHISRGNHDAAAAVLEKLIAREPQNAQHKTKLAFVKQQKGGGAEAPAARPKAAAPPKVAPRPPVAAPPEEEAYEIDTELSLDLDASGADELDLSLDSSPVSAVPPPPPIIDTVGERADEDEDLDYITEHLTEAEVFAKYGLIDKAAEHLRSVIDRAPKHLPAYDKLYRILLEEGQVEQARQVALTYVGLLGERGDMAEADTVQNEFLTRGQPLKPAAKKTPTVEKPLPKAAPAPAKPAAAAPKPAPAPPKPAPAPPKPAAAPPKPAPRPPVVEEPEESETTFELESDDGIEIQLDQPADDSPIVLEEISTPEPFYGVEAESSPAVEAPTAEELGEIDFYIEQELFDEAREKIDALLERYPDSTDLAERSERIEAARSAAAEAAPEIIDFDKDITSGLLEEEEITTTIAAPPPPPAKAAAPPPPPQPAAAAQEENLFADEDNFFDLAAELEEELSDDADMMSLSEEEQSLEEIFKEFKKGVEQQLDSEDYDTHYNLGIAYKEMGLTDEAIGEFQLASKDPKRAVECASMLGLCFLEKGMPQLAIKWYRKGLEIPEIREEEHMGLLYDLGSAYVEVGDTQNAHKAFLEVYGINSNYRDIVSRIKQLEDVKQ
jgi:pilus assembly protein FimV